MRKVPISVQRRDPPAESGARPDWAAPCGCRSRALYNGGRNFHGGGGTIFRRPADLIRAAHNGSALQRSAAHQNAPALRPVIAPAGRIHLRSTAEFAHREHHGAAHQAPLAEVFQQRGVSVIEHRPDQVLIAADRAERLRSMDVPGDLVEHGFKHVDGHKTYAGFNHAARQQAALAEPVHAVLLPDLLRLLVQLEGLARLLRRHQRIGLLKGGIQQPRILRGLKHADGFIHHAAPVLPAIHPQRREVVGRQQIRHAEIRIRRVRVQHKRIEAFTQEAGVLAVRHVAAGVPDRPRQQHVRRHVAIGTPELAEHAAHVRMLMPP
jgi:hypothetical protein